MKKYFLDTSLLPLYLILLLGAVLRLYGLTNQSLWLDELHTMVESDPSASWSDLFHYLKCCDQHPPLFFITERLLFFVFGYSELVARGLTATCGIVSIWGMYLLGEELFDKKLGFTAALLTAINFFNVDYSQEARGYIMAMLFAIFSYLHFIKLIKNQKSKSIWLWALFTLLMLYSHYFSLFVVASQGLVAVILWFFQKDNRYNFFLSFLKGGTVVLIGYLPWVPFLMEMSKIQSFWIQPISQDFAATFFLEYFGNNGLIQPLVIFLLIYFCWQAITENDLSMEKIKESPLQLTFFVFSVSIFVCYLLPYLRSILVVPMLISRYTIVILPAFLIALSFSFRLIKNRIIFSVLLSMFVILSLVDLLITKKYYSSLKIRKTQFREMTEFISEDPKYIYPIIEERTAWQHQYYLKRYNYSGPVLPGGKEELADLIISGKDEKYDLKGFWIVGAHGGEAHLSAEKQQKLLEKYSLVKEKEFFDTWAQLYVKLTDAVKYFSGRVNFANEVVVPMWSGAISSQSFSLPAGNYEMAITHIGTIAQKAFPHVVVYVDGNRVGEFTTVASFQQSTFKFKTDKEAIVLKLDFDNDLMASGEDRNAFIKSILIEQIN